MVTIDAEIFGCIGIEHGVEVTAKVLEQQPHLNRAEVLDEAKRDPCR
jgi:hypothetical protein